MRCPALVILCCILPLRLLAQHDAGDALVLLAIVRYHQGDGAAGVAAFRAACSPRCEGLDVAPIEMRPKTH